MEEINYDGKEMLFAIQIECKLCGKEEVTVKFDPTIKALILKCENKECNAEDIIYL